MRQHWSCLLMTFRGFKMRLSVQSLQDFLVAFDIIDHGILLDQLWELEMGGTILW